MATAAEMVANAPSSLKTALASYRNRAAKSHGGDARTDMSMATVLEEAGLDPTDFYSVPSMEGRLSDEQLRQYQATVESILSSTYVEGSRNAKKVGDHLADMIEYQQAALEEAARNFETLNDPNASEQDRAKARMSISQLGTRDMGSWHNEDSPLYGFREKGAAYFEEDARWASIPEDEKAQYLDDAEQLSEQVDDFLVGDQVDQRGESYRDRNAGIQRATTTVQDIGAREVGDKELLSGLGLERTVGADELIDPLIASQIVSQWDNPEFLDSIDRTGQQSMGRSLDYFDELIANDGRDAVSDAFMNRATREAEMLRKANVDAALANLDARGMSGSGGQLQAYLQGAGQSMAAQFDAAMEAAAMQQQRRDAAAEQRATIGEARQLLENGQAQTMAEAMDMARRSRATMEAQIAQENAGKATSAADQTFAWDAKAAESDAAKQTNAADATYDWQARKAMTDAGLSDTAERDRFQRAGQVEDNVFESGLKGVVRDAGTRQVIAEGDRAATEAGKSAAAGHGLDVADLAIRSQIANQGEPQDVNGWDIAGAVADFIPAGGEVVGLAKSIFDDEDD